MVKKLFFFLGLLPIFTASFASSQEPTPPSEKRRPSLMLEGVVEVVSVQEAGDRALPHEKYPGIKFMRSDEFLTKYPDRSTTPSGLYLVDSELIPRELNEILTVNGLALGRDGSVINRSGGRAVMVLGHKLVRVRQKQGSLPGWRGFFGLLGPTPARAAFPYAWEWWDAWWSWTDDEGFCRSLKVSTGANAWGPVIDAQGDRAHTNIEQIETFAQAVDQTDDKVCNNCPSSYSHAEKDFGCWWPAHAGGQWAWAALKDGATSFSWSP